MAIEQWVCDKCGELIKKREDGWVTWTRDLNNNTLSDFKIIHYPNCQQPEPRIRKSRLSALGDPIAEFQGQNGLIRLLELIPQVQKENQNQILSIIQRLHIPGYEMARLNFEKVAVDGRIVPATHGLYYLTVEKMAEINKEYS